MSVMDDVMNFLSGGNNAKVEGLLRQNATDVDKIVPPNISEMQIQLAQLVQQGRLDPREAEAILQEQSQMQGVQTAPELRAAQMKALAGLQDITANKGLTAIDRRNMAQISDEELAQQRGQQEAIMQNAQQRGISGSGIEMASQLMGQQQSANRQSRRGMDVAAMAQERALQALMQSGQLGGSIRSQDFDEQARKAAAQDAINQFNAATRNQNNQFNTNTFNNAQAQNLAAQQNIANQNVGIANTQQMHNKGLPQQAFQNQLQKQGMKSGVNQQLAAQYGQQGAQSSAMLGGLLSQGLAAALAPATGGASIVANEANKKK